MNTDLFGASTLLAGLCYREFFVSADEEQILIEKIDTAELSPFRFQQWTGKRLTRSFGWSYDFETGKFGEAEPIPSWLLPIRARAAAFAGLGSDDLAQAMVIRYDPGAEIGWHRDRPVFEDVVGISLGAPAVLRFRRRTETGFARSNAPLAPCSVYSLSGQARYDWEHGIAPVAATRWSITFRSLVR